MRTARHRSCHILSAASAAVLGPAALAAPFALTYDLRIHETSGKTATVGQVGDAITLDLYAIISGRNSDFSDDTMNSGGGKFLSSTGGLLGDLVSLPPVAPFDQTGSSPGLSRDYDGDGDLDVAGYSDTAYHHWSPRHASPPRTSPARRPSSTGSHSVPACTNTR